MPHDATIDDPRPGVVSLGASRSFAAFGSTGAAPKKVRCYLLGGKRNRVMEGRPLPQPPGAAAWAAAFTGVPLGDSYALELVEAENNARLAVVYGLDLRVLLRGTLIHYPGSGDIVPPTFTAYGSTDKQVTGAQMVNGSNTIDGTILQNQNAWYASFSGVPTGSGWTLNVSNTQSSPADSADNLTVATP